MSQEHRPRPCNQNQWKFLDFILIIIIVINHHHHHHHHGVCILHRGSSRIFRPRPKQSKGHNCYDPIDPALLRKVLLRLAWLIIQHVRLPTSYRPSAYRISCRNIVNPKVPASGKQLLSITSNHIFCFVSMRMKARKLRSAKGAGRTNKLTKLIHQQ